MKFLMNATRHVWGGTQPPDASSQSILARSTRSIRARSSLRDSFPPLSHDFDPMEEEYNNQQSHYTYPQPLAPKAAPVPGSIFNRQGGSKFNRRRQYTTSKVLKASNPPVASLPSSAFAGLGPEQPRSRRPTVLAGRTGALSSPSPRADRVALSLEKQVKERNLSH